MDLLDWHRGRLTSRRLAVLVQHLPRDSSTLREIHGEAADWSAAEHLLAAAVDRLSEANWMFATVNRDEDAEALDYPEPVPRPTSSASTDHDDDGDGDGTGDANGSRDLRENGSGNGNGSGNRSRGGSGGGDAGGRLGAVPDIAPGTDPGGLENAAARLPSAAELARFFA